MAENEQSKEGEAAQAPAGGGKRKLFIIIGAVVLLLGAGAGGYFMFFAKKDHKVAEAPPPKPPVFIDMPELLVNMSPAPGERPQYLKVKLVLEVKEAPQAALIQPNIPRVMDIFQTYLREVRPSDLNGSAGMYRLKEELTRRVNVAVAPTQVSAVLFKEILVQ